MELESAIIRELEKLLLEHSGLLLQLANLLAELDWCAFNSSHLRLLIACICSVFLVWPPLHARPSGRAPCSLPSRSSTLSEVGTPCRNFASLLVRGITTVWHRTEVHSHSEQYVDVGSERRHAQAHLGTQRLGQERIREASWTDSTHGAHRLLRPCWCGYLL